MTAQPIALTAAELRERFDREALRRAVQWGFNPADPQSIDAAIDRLDVQLRPDPADQYRDRASAAVAQHRQDCADLRRALCDIRARGAHINPEQESMKYSEQFPSAGNYLTGKGWPPNKDVTVTIASVEIAHLEGEDPKPALSFKGKDKQLLLNKTNAATLVDAYGDEMDNWIGKPITIFRMMVTFQGQPVPALRVRIPPQQQMPPQQAASMAAQAPSEAPFNDDIPW